MDTQIEELLSDREKFNEFVYTPREEAIKKFKIREDDQNIQEYLWKDNILDLPEMIKEKKPAVLFRNIVTSNHEVMRFLSLVDAIDGFYPLLLEYKEDKFTDNNEWKHSLGKIPFFLGLDKNHNKRLQKVSVIDFTAWNGKKISEVETFWGQKLADFHHELLTTINPRADQYVILDISEWISNSGGNAGEYYKHFLKLFLSKALLFENFMLSPKELSFTREVFLPAFIEICAEVGQKPLIIALEPTDIEGDNFWISQPHASLDFVKKKLNSL